MSQICADGGYGSGPLSAFICAICGCLPGKALGPRFREDERGWFSCLAPQRRAAVQVSIHHEGHEEHEGLRLFRPNAKSQGNLGRVAPSAQRHRLFVSFVVFVLKKQPATSSTSKICECPIGRRGLPSVPAGTPAVQRVGDGRQNLRQRGSHPRGADGQFPGLVGDEPSFCGGLDVGGGDLGVVGQGGADQVKAARVGDGA
jgi:hypothetical protein